MKTFILFITFLSCILCIGCSTIIVTEEKIDATTGEPKYTNDRDRILFADVKAKGYGKISKTVKWDSNGNLIEYSITSDPSAGAADITEKVGKLGATAVGAGVDAFKFVVPIE